MEHLNRPENFGLAADRYASTKLLLQYAFEELVMLARKDGDNNGPCEFLSPLPSLFPFLS